MQIIENAFDKNPVMFDASASLTYMRVHAGPDDTYGIIVSDKEREVKAMYPRLYEELQAHLHNKVLYELVFFKTKDQSKQKDYRVVGKATVFIISSKHGSKYKPGTIIQLDKDEEISFSFEDFNNHFIGIAYE